MVSDNDAFAEAGKSAKKEIDELVNLAREAIDVDTSVAQLEAALKEARSRLHKLTTIQIPDAMAEIGMDSFTLPSGVSISINQIISGSLPKDPSKRESAIDWLDENGAGSLVKTGISVLIPREDREKAIEISNELHDKGFDPEMKEDVHAGTLKKFARERLEKGEDVPFDLLGLYNGRVAKLTMPKK